MHMYNKSGKHAGCMAFICGADFAKSCSFLNGGRSFGGWGLSKS